MERRDPGELAEDEEEEDDEDMENASEDGANDLDEDEESSEESVAEDDDEDLDDAENTELRRKIEEALRVNGIQAATGESDSDSEEDLMDDEQMMAIDEQLAAVFKARSDERKLGKGKLLATGALINVDIILGVDVQREATHYKNRVLDLLDGYLKKQPSSSQLPRLILPLVELATISGTDERQLADKATGILRSRIGKSRDLPQNIDCDQTAGILRELHARARKAISADILATLSQCSLFLTKCLVHAQHEAPVVEVYRDSLKDFVTRKASRLNTSFFQDLVRRYPNIAWDFRMDFIAVIDTAINGYRRTQVFHLLQVLCGQLNNLVRIIQFVT